MNANYTIVFATMASVRTLLEALNVSAQLATQLMIQRETV